MSSIDLFEFYKDQKMHAGQSVIWILSKMESIMLKI